MRAEISVCLPECTAKRLDDPAKTSHLTKAAPIIQGMEFIPAPQLDCRLTYFLN